MLSSSLKSLPVSPVLNELDGGQAESGALGVEIELHIVGTLDSGAGIFMTSFLSMARLPS